MSRLRAKRCFDWNYVWRGLQQVETEAQHPRGCAADGAFAGY